MARSTSSSGRTIRPRRLGMPASPGPGALQDPHQDRLGLVVGGVAERDAPRPGRPGATRAQRGVPDDPRRFLGECPRRAARRPATTRAGQPSRAASASTKAASRSALGPKAVVDVADGEPKRVLGCGGARARGGGRPSRGRPRRLRGRGLLIEEAVARRPRRRTAAERPRRRRRPPGTWPVIGHRRRSTPAAATRLAGPPRRTHPRTARASRSGTILLDGVDRVLAASKASWRCAADTPIATLASPTESRPIRCRITTCRTPGHARRPPRRSPSAWPRPSARGPRIPAPRRGGPAVLLRTTPRNTATPPASGTVTAWATASAERGSSVTRYIRHAPPLTGGKHASSSPACTGRSPRRSRCRPRTGCEGR